MRAGGNVSSYSDRGARGGRPMYRGGMERRPYHAAVEEEEDEEDPEWVEFDPK